MLKFSFINNRRFIHKYALNNILKIEKDSKNSYSKIEKLFRDISINIKEIKKSTSDYKYVELYIKDQNQYELISKSLNNYSIKFSINFSKLINSGVSVYKRLVVNNKPTGDIKYIKENSLYKCYDLNDENFIKLFYQNNEKIHVSKYYYEYIKNKSQLKISPNIIQIKNLKKLKIDNLLELFKNFTFNKIVEPHDKQGIYKLYCGNEETYMGLLNNLFFHNNICLDIKPYYGANYQIFQNPVKSLKTFYMYSSKKITLDYIQNLFPEHKNDISVFTYDLKHVLLHEIRCFSGVSYNLFKFYNGLPINKSTKYTLIYGDKIESPDKLPSSVLTCIRADQNMADEFTIKYPNTIFINDKNQLNSKINNYVDYMHLYNNGFEFRDTKYFFHNAVQPHYVQSSNKYVFRPKVKSEVSDQETDKDIFAVDNIVEIDQLGNFVFDSQDYKTNYRLESLNIERFTRQIGDTISENGYLFIPYVLSTPYIDKLPNDRFLLLYRNRFHYTIYTDLNCFFLSKYRKKTSREFPLFMSIQSDSTFFTISHLNMNSVIDLLHNNGIEFQYAFFDDKIRIFLNIYDYNDWDKFISNFLKCYPEYLINLYIGTNLLKLY